MQFTHFFVNNKSLENEFVSLRKYVKPYKICSINTISSAIKSFKELGIYAKGEVG